MPLLMTTMVRNHAPLEIRDPIHGPILVQPEELQIIDSPYVQRLRGIKQTGFAELGFPGATHNRYSHSLGAFHLAGKAFDQIFLHFPWKDSEEKKRFRFLLRMAALLHDLGHGPLSHAIEQAMPARAEVTEGEGQATHEDYTEAIILKSSLCDKLKKVFGNEASELIISIIRNKNKNPSQFMAGTPLISLFPILSALISGELDVDRMDYMPRDSLYCGIPYGHFDREWILSNLTYTLKDGVAYLALDARALYAFEDFLLSRYHMYLMVYLHHKSVVYDEMLYQFLKKGGQHTRLPSSVEEYLRVDDYWLQQKLRQSEDPWAQRIIQQRPYKMLLELHSDQTAETKHYADQLEEQLKQARISYFRSSSTGLLSKYADLDPQQSNKNSIFIVYRDSRFVSASKPTVREERLEDATELFARYKRKRIIERIFAESYL